MTLLSAHIQFLVRSLRCRVLRCIASGKKFAHYALHSLVAVRVHGFSQGN